MRISDWSSDVCSSDLNIRVNTIIPGNVETPRQAKWYTPEGEAEIIAAQCLKARVQPADVAAMALFLASDDARMCTGHDYWVDLTSWLARHEPDPYLKKVYEFALLEDYDHLYRYATLMAIGSASCRERVCQYG